LVLVKQQETVNYSILKNVEFPSDIRKLNIAELNTLAQEIRELIINTVASSGGHLLHLWNSELTLALHYVFNTPQDKIIWDVGHQLTRIKLSPDAKINLPLCAGKTVSAISKREESPYDVFNVGHSGTSILPHRIYRSREFKRRWQ